MMMCKGATAREICLGPRCAGPFGAKHTQPPERGLQSASMSEVLGRWNAPRPLPVAR